MTDATPKERLQKFISSCGHCSRRRAEELITGGQVSVNGEPVTKLGARVDPAVDVVTISGRVVRPPQSVTIVLNKPAGCITSMSDPQRRRTVMDLLPRELVERGVGGGLDLETEGLLIMTNDGALLNEITHPRYRCEKEYRALVSRAPTHREYQRLKSGVRLAEEGKDTAPARLHQISARPDGSAIVHVTLREGMKRQVRRMFQTVGITVLELERVAIGPLRLGALARGAWRELTAREIAGLRPR